MFSNFIGIWITNNISDLEKNTKPGIDRCPCYPEAEHNSKDTGTNLWSGLPGLASCPEGGKQAWVRRAVLPRCSRKHCTTPSKAVLGREEKPNLDPSRHKSDWAQREQASPRLDGKEVLLAMAFLAGYRTQQRQTGTVVLTEPSWSTVCKFTAPLIKTMSEMRWFQRVSSIRSKMKF